MVVTGEGDRRGAESNGGGLGRLAARGHIVDNGCAREGSVASLEDERDGDGDGRQPHDFTTIARWQNEKMVEEYVLYDQPDIMAQIS